MNWLLKLLGCKEEELKLQIENLKKERDKLIGKESE